MIRRGAPTALSILPLFVIGLALQSGDLERNVGQLLKQGDRQAARDLARSALESATDLRAEATAARLLVEALDYAGPEARQLAQRVAELASSSGTAVRVVEALELESEVSRTAGDLEAAERQLRQAIELARRDLPRERQVRARLDAALGSLLTERGRYDEAIELLEVSLALAEELHGEDSPELAAALALLGHPYLYSGRFDQAKAYYERSLELRRRLAGDEASAEVASVLYNLGNLMTVYGQLEKARELLEEALEIFLATLGPDHERIGYVSNSLGNVSQDQGRLDEARRHYRRALDVWLPRFGPDHFRLSMLYHNLGNVEEQVGNLVEARRQYERALAIRQRTFGREHVETLRTRGELARLALRIGDLDDAVSESLDVLQLRRKILGDLHPEVAGSLDTLAGAAGQRGDLQTAKSYLEQSLAIREAFYPPSSPDLAFSYQEFGDLHLALGDRESAARLHRKALDLRRQAFPEGNAAVAWSLDRWAASVLAEQPEEARKALLEAREIRGRAYGDDHPHVAGGLATLAELYWQEGELDEARRAASEASEILARHIWQTVLTLPESEGLALLSSLGGLARPEEILFSGLLAQPDRGEWLEAAWRFALQRKGVVLEALATRRQVVLESEAPVARAAWNRLTEARRAYSRSGLEALVSPGPEARQTLQAARREREEAERRLAAVSGLYRRVTEDQAIRLEEVEAALPAGGALVEVVRLPIQEPRSTTREPHYIALLLLSEGGRSVVDLGPAEAMDAAVERWRHRLKETVASALLDDGWSPEALLADGLELRRRLWDPLQAKLAAADLVLFSPDGLLNSVSIEALPLDGERFVLDDGPAMQLVSSAREVVRVARRAPEPARFSHRSALVVGGADFDAALERGEATSPTTFFRGAPPACDALPRSWAGLPGSLREAAQISELLDKEGSTTLLVGSEASEARFKAEVAEHEILHLATHGYFLDRSCRSSTTAPLSPAGIGGENPLILSGLVFAGANHPPTDREEGEDGLLTAEESAALDLRGVELAVLSACDTGQGQVVSGEGVFGLRRALEISGVRTQVMSLWQLPDEPARRWNRAFYGALLAGSSPVRASRQASRELLAGLRREGRPTHPYLWGGYVVAGDWR